MKISVEVHNFKQNRRKKRLMSFYVIVIVVVVRLHPCSDIHRRIA
jgi:hypothetical protein